MTIQTKVCPNCGQNIPLEILRQKQKEQSVRISEALKRAKARGIHIGRPNTRPDEKIWRLRDEGLSMREIAKAVGVCHSTVHLSLKLRTELYD